MGTGHPDSFHTPKLNKYQPAALILQQYHQTYTMVASGSLTTLARLSSQMDVNYSCGSCGYALNLSSSNRNTDTIGSKYGKLIKKGVVSFNSVDESRFGHRDRLACLPYFNASTRSWGLVRRRTNMCCRNCGTLIGTAYATERVDGDGQPQTRYDIRIGALQPSA